MEQLRKIDAPWTDEQVAALQRYQDTPWVHGFTCMGYNGCKRSEQENDGELKPTNEGWVCPCGKYKQDWAYRFMFEEPKEPLEGFKTKE